METEKEERGQNRETILQCASHLFYSKGYDAVGVQEIADASKITKPTLYYYFKSKRGLLETLLKEKCSALNGRLAEKARGEGDLKEILFQIAMVYLNEAKQDREFYFLMIALFYSARDNEAYLTMKPYMTEQFNILTGVFMRAAPLLGNMNGRHEQFAIGFSGILNLYILVWYEKGREREKLADREAALSLVHQFMHGIFS